MLRQFAILFLSVVTSSCGFQLRDEISLPEGLRKIHLLVADPAYPLQKDLAASLQRAGAEISAVPEHAAQINVPVNAMTTEVLTASGQARVTEFQVRYHVAISVADDQGKILLPLADIVLAREYSFDQTQVLGMAGEEELIKKELQREMLQQILRKIESLGGA